jgi:rhodanese-related sulfurtransferase
MKSFPQLIKEANDQIKSVSVQELKSFINDPNIIIIDVQSKDAVEKSGMIPNAVHSNRGFLEFYFDQRPDNPFKKLDVKPEDKIVVYCGAGGQGALATKTLQDMGFKDVSNLEGGSNAWVEAGNTLTK